VDEIERLLSSGGKKKSDIKVLNKTSENGGGRLFEIKGGVGGMGLVLGLQSRGKVKFTEV